FLFCFECSIIIPQHDSVSSGSGHSMDKDKTSESNPFLGNSGTGQNVEMKGK
ncbi:sodium channel protein type 4 subunit alpha B, partial [Biomphalaria pfeifferi]